MDAVFNLAKMPKFHNTDGSLNRESAAKFLGALQHYMGKPALLEAAYRRLPLAELTTSDDFPEKMKELVKMMMLTPQDVDLTYEQVFDIGDYTATNKSGFKVRKASSGLAFKRVLPGERIDVFKFTGADYEVSFDDYGGAVGFLNRWFEDEDFINIASAATEFRAKYYQKKAQAFIALIEAVASTYNVAFQELGTNSIQVLRDIWTINAVIEKLIEINDKDHANTGFVGDSTQFIIYAPLALKRRILSALDTSWHGQKDAVSAKVIYNITPLFSPNFGTQTVFYGIVPKQLLQGGNRKNLETPSQPDILANAQVIAGWGRYGGAIGTVADSAGVQRVVTVVRGATS